MRNLLPRILVGSFVIVFTMQVIAQTLPIQSRLIQHHPIQHPTSRQPLVTALPIEKMKLLGPNTGWASTGNRLLWTTDNGEHWRDISPPRRNGDRYADVFFLDGETGWVLLVGYPRRGECSVNDRSESDWAFHVAATVNGGESWTETHIKTPSCDSGNFSASLGENGNVTFADKLHGWMMLEHQSGSAFSFGTLLATSNGGHTWREAKGTPGFYGNIRAFSNGTIWVERGDSSDDELAVSRDEGDSFQEVSLEAPAEILPAVGPTYGLPFFENNAQGYEAVSYDGPAGKEASAVLFETRDGGRTWKPDRILSNLAHGEVVPTSVADSIWVLPFAPPGGRLVVLQLGSNQKMMAPADRKGGDFRRCRSSFFTSNKGWLTCSGTLLSTSDGGTSLTDITPRARGGALTTEPITPKEHTSAQMIVSRLTVSSKARPTVVTLANGGSQSSVSEGLGFDRDYILSTDDMAAWWASSPYYYVGIYLPGGISGPNNAPTSKHPDRILLGADWVSTVLTQGWGIIPIWSGPQPPCTVEPHRHTFSSDPDTARAQGQEQADFAYNSATNLGLDGSIIYVDIEQYNHTVCGAAVESYVQGWVEEMHEYGLAGVYGNQDTAALDLTAADEGYITRADRHVTVWGLNHYSGSGLTDDLAWTNRQRIHQYRTDRYEIWGGVGPYKIDNDLVDAVIIPSSGTKYYDSFLTPTEANTGGLAGISNGINNGTTLLIGTVVGPSDDYGVYDGQLGVFIDSPTDGITFLTTFANDLVAVGGINNVGQVVGIDPNFGGFLYTPGANSSIIQILGPNGELVAPSSINDAGWILGYYQDQDLNLHCVLTKPPYTSPISFDFIGNFGCAGNAFGSELWGNWGEDLLEINGLGQIAGDATVGTGSILVVRANGIPFATPAQSSQFQTSIFIDDIQSGIPGPTDNPAILATFDSSDPAYVVSGINNNGQIAGTYSSNPGGWEYGPDTGFLLDTNGTAWEFSILSPEWGYVSGLNDEVQIVGTEVFPSGDVVGFIVDTQH